VPNPSSRGPVVSFTLPDARPARLEVIDLAGRRVVERAVGVLGAGPHVLDLSAARGWRPGIYWLQLSREGESLRRKVCVLQ